MTRPVRTAFLLVLAICASSLAFFFDDANPNVALLAIAAWGCLLVAMVRVR